MFVAAPISMIGGVVMALREDAGLSWLVLSRYPFWRSASGWWCREWCRCSA